MIKDLYDNKQVSIMACINFKTTNSQKHQIIRKYKELYDILKADKF